MKRIIVKAEIFNIENSSTIKIILPNVEDKYDNIFVTKPTQQESIKTVRDLFKYSDLFKLEFVVL